VPEDFDRADVVLITAISEEHRAMKECFGVSFESKLRDGIHYSVGVLKRRERFLRIAAVRPAEMGPIPAAVITTRAIHDWRPCAIIMTGICAGMEGMVRIGDLVIANQVFDHAAGTFRGGHLTPFQQSVSQDPWILQFLGGVNEDRRTVTHLFSSHPGPSVVEVEHRVHVGAMASGSFVVKDESYMRSLLERTSKLLALDMESYGVASAAKMCSTMRKPVSWLIVKGVSDYGDSSKADDWHDYCSFVSAKYVRLGLEVLLKRDKAYQFVVDRRE
jgi:nucleoside phosphorylase